MHLGYPSSEKNSYQSALDCHCTQERTSKSIAEFKFKKKLIIAVNFGRFEETSQAGAIAAILIHLKAVITALKKEKKRTIFYRSYKRKKNGGKKGKSRNTVRFRVAPDYNLQYIYIYLYSIVESGCGGDDSFLTSATFLSIYIIYINIVFFSAKTKLLPRHPPDLCWTPQIPESG